MGDAACFPFQVVLAIVVVLPLCWATAGLLDRAVDAVVLLVRRCPHVAAAAPLSPPAERPSPDDRVRVVVVPSRSSTAPVVGAGRALALASDVDAAEAARARRR